MTQPNLQVLVVDDTIVYRRVLSTVIESIPGCTLAGTAPNGKIALDKLKSMPVDVMLLDVEMPVLDGLSTLEVMRREHPDIGVIMISGANENAAGITIKALERGALDFIPKPDGPNMEASQAQLVAHIRRLVQHFHTQRMLKTARRPASGAPASAVTPRRAATVSETTPAAPVSPPPTRPGKRPAKIEVVAIGVSTGGPNALKEVIPKLPADLNVPVLLVQHMPPLFTKSLADSLNRNSAMQVQEARDGDSVAPNTVLIAPGGKHMVVRRDDAGSYVVALNENPPEHNCRPSVNVLFRSVATYFGGKVLSVVMTGMGEDGCEGVRVMKRQGCISLTQAESSCVVYGMPRAVVEAGLSDEQVPLGQLAERIERMVRNPATGR